MRPRVRTRPSWSSRPRRTRSRPCRSSATTSLVRSRPSSSRRCTSRASSAGGRAVKEPSSTSGAGSRALTAANATAGESPSSRPRSGSLSKPVCPSHRLSTCPACSSTPTPMLTFRCCDITGASPPVVILDSPPTLASNLGSVSQLALLVGRLVARLSKLGGELCPALDLWAASDRYADRFDCYLPRS
jgi:hypothetical protein